MVQTVAAQIADLANNADVAAVAKIVQAATEEYNMKLIASACTRQDESDVLPARQLGQTVPPFTLQRETTAPIALRWRTRG
jgi:hypothetical protein